VLLPRGRRWELGRGSRHGTPAGVLWKRPSAASRRLLVASSGAVAATDGARKRTPPGQDGAPVGGGEREHAASKWASAGGIDLDG